MRRIIWELKRIIWELRYYLTLHILGWVVHIMPDGADKEMFRKYMLMFYCYVEEHGSWYGGGNESERD